DVLQVDVLGDLDEIPHGGTLSPQIISQRVHLGDGPHTYHAFNRLVGLAADVLRADGGGLRGLLALRLGQELALDVARNFPGQLSRDRLGNVETLNEVEKIRALRGKVGSRA